MSETPKANSNSFAKHFLAILFYFIISRIIFYILGVRFDAATLDNYIQYIDPFYLKTRLWESIFYLHSQPPLFNLFLGIILKLFPNNYPIVFHAIYLLMGLGIAGSIFYLMVRLGVHLWIAHVLTFLFVINPATILHENWLFYSYPEVLCVCLTLLFLMKFMDKFQFLYICLFFLCFSVLVLTKSTYHMVLFILIFFILLTIFKEHYRKILMAAFIPFLLIVSVSLKNLIIFKTFSTSIGFTGYQLSTMIIPNLSKENFKETVDNENMTLEHLLEISSFELMSTSFYNNVRIEKIGIPILDNFKKKSGEPNLESIYHLKTAKYYENQALRLYRLYPELVFKGIKRSFSVYCFPGPTDVEISNRKHISQYEHYYNVMFAHLNKINSYQLYSHHLLSFYHFDSLKWDGLSRILFTCVVIFFIWLILYGLNSVLKKQNDEQNSKQIKVALAYLLGMIIYVTLISTLFSGFGNNRYRYAIDPLYLMLLGKCLTEFTFKKFRLQS